MIICTIGGSRPIMNITFNKATALRITRGLRSMGVALGTPCDLIPPSPAPSRRWTRSRVSLAGLGVGESASETLDVVVPSRESRIQARFASNTTYLRSIPSGSFRRVGNGISITGPELLFYEMATIMAPPILSLLGYELCGAFSRSPEDPRRGEVRLGLPPATSVERISRFLHSCPDCTARATAVEALASVRDNAWSPMEATIAVMALLPPHQLGYGFRDLRLNQRVTRGADSLAGNSRGSRIPDLLFSGSRVGLNYDGRGHLNLASIAEAASLDGAGDAIRAVRAKYVDDIRRDRELASHGMVVLPVVAEDLFEAGGLDALMLAVAGAVGASSDLDVSPTLNAIRARGLRFARQELIWSLLPWDRGDHYVRELLRRERAARRLRALFDSELAF